AGGVWSRSGEDVLDPDAGPVDVVHAPARDAVEVRNLFHAREGAQLVIRERDRPLDEAADLQPPGGGVEGRHVAGDRVDAPAAGGDDRRESIGDGGDDAGDVIPGGLAPVEGRDAAHHGREKQPPPVTPRLGLMLSGDGRRVHYMCAMPANSFPRNSPGWPFVATQTQ